MAIMFKIRIDIKKVLILPLLLFAVCLIAAEKEDPIEAITFEATKANIRRQQYYSDANNKTIAGNKAFEKKEYQKAIDNYLDAIELLKKCSLVNKNITSKISSCKKKIAQSYEYWSRSLFLQAEKELQVQNLTTAIELCTKASEIYPQSKERNDELIEQYKEKKKKLAFTVNTDVNTVIPDLETRKYNIALLMRQGKSFMDANEFDKARDKFEEILIIDPYNTEANDMIYRVNMQSFKQARSRYNNTHNKMIAEAEWKGVNSILPKTYTGLKNNLNAPIKKEIVEDAIYKKLRSIKIDHIEFEEVSIPTVIKFLKMRSKDIDPEKIGVNIFIRPSVTDSVQQTQQTAVAPAPALGGGGDDFGDDDDDDFGDDDDIGGGKKAATPTRVDNMPTVTMVVSDISLFDAIRYICRAANLKYRVEKYAVVIAPKDVPLDDVETRIYPIEHESIDSIGGGDTEAVKQHFVSRGVTFPIGAKIVYDSRISRLIATNTPENLKMIESIIHNELNTVDPQVLIQAKFVEISQNDMEELGFNYTLERSLNTTNPITNAPFQKSNRGRVEFGKSSEQLVRSAAGVPDTALQFTSFANGWTFAAYVYALDQCNSQDILSTPRITTMNGQEATIRMISEVYYPSDWSEPETATTTGDDSSDTITSYVSSIPEFDDPTEEGIVLRVTPNVDADQYTITLVMTPVIQRFIGWTDYSYDVTIREGDHAIVVTNTIKQPVIAARTVETTVSIYDGETIVLGGIIKDNVEDMDDNIPFLGRLPFIGRFFQSKGTSKEKSSLLIFLTCRLVNPDGTPIRERKRRGLPAFRR